MHWKFSQKGVLHIVRSTETVLMGDSLRTSGGNGFLSIMNTETSCSSISYLNPGAPGDFSIKTQNRPTSDGSFSANIWFQRKFRHVLKSSRPNSFISGNNPPTRPHCPTKNLAAIQWILEIPGKWAPAAPVFWIGPHLLKNTEFPFSQYFACFQFWDRFQFYRIPILSRRRIH